MIAENRLLFACTRQNFQESHQQMVLELLRHAQIQWDVVYATALAHGVAPLVYANLRRCSADDLGIPPPILDRFRRSCYGNVVIQERRAAKLAEVLAYFDARGIDVMLIKGAALDLLVYEHPWYKAADDVDLVLRQKREDVSEADQTQLMQSLHDTGIEYDYFTHHDVVLNGLLPIDFNRIWDEASRIEFGGAHAFVMSLEDMLMTACTNSCRKRYFRLKSLCDIAEIINRYPQLRWQELIQKTKEYQCNPIVYAALLATQMTVGCALPDRVLRDLGVGPVRAAIIRRVISHLSQRVPLSSLYPYTAGEWRDRRINLALILPYVTYRREQVWRKLRQLFREWRRQD